MVLVGLFILVLAFVQVTLDEHQQKLYQQPAWRPSIRTFSRHGIVQMPAIVMMPYTACVTFTGKLVGLFLMLIAMSFNIVLILLVAMSLTIAKVSSKYPRPALSMDALKHTENQQITVQLNDDIEQTI